MIKGVRRWDEICAAVEGSGSYESAVVAVAALADSSDAGAEVILRMSLEAVGRWEPSPSGEPATTGAGGAHSFSAVPRRELVEVIDPQQASWISRVRWVEMTKDLLLDQAALDAIDREELTLEEWLEETYDLDEEGAACVMLIELGDHTADGRAQLRSHAATFDQYPRS